VGTIYFQNTPRYENHNISTEEHVLAWTSSSLRRKRLPGLMRLLARTRKSLSHRGTAEQVAAAVAGQGISMRGSTIACPVTDRTRAQEFPWKGNGMHPYDSMDHLPYGEQIAADTGTTQKFTSKERDAETNFDYFGARYYSSSLGRFIWCEEQLALHQGWRAGC